MKINRIKEKIISFSRYYMIQEYDSLAHSYTKNAQILPPGSDIIIGREAIKKRWILPKGVQVLLHQVDPIEIEVVGTTAYDIGYYNGKTLRKDGSISEWKGKYLIVWKKVAGEWKIYSDAWNRID